MCKKVVAIQTIGGASGHMTRELLHKNGIDWQRDVTIQVIESLKGVNS